MNLISFTVRDSTGNVLRTGHCQAADLEHQAGEGETAKAARPGDRAEQAVALEGIRQKVKKLKEEAATPLDVLVEALRAKGVDVSLADLEAAAGTLQARRKGRESGRKEP